LWLLSFAIIGGIKKPQVEIARLGALPAGLAIIFAL
jgi:hypothetical protein